jgi:phosphonate transport system permease protein
VASLTRRLARTPQQPDLTALKAQLLQPFPRIGLRAVLLTLIGLGALYWGILGTRASPAEFIDGLPNIWNFLVELFPPRFETETHSLAVTSIPYPTIVDAIVETLQLAIVGTLFAIVLSSPFAILASRNIAPPPLYGLTRLLLNANRAIPDIIFALIFVAAVGLGPFGGVLALAIGSIGFMSKVYAEAIEAIDPQQVLAVRATGASRAQTIVYAVAPQAMPMIASYSLLLFETNIRSATVLGIVGAGGVGFELQKYMSLFQYQYLTGALIIIIVVVTLIDRISDRIRKSIT